MRLNINKPIDSLVMRKITTYSRPSIADHITSGAITPEQGQSILSQMEKGGDKSSKTIKRIRQAIAQHEQALSN